MTTAYQEMVGTGDIIPSRISIDLYHAMIRSGELPESSGIELIDGMLVCKDRRDTNRDSIMVHGPRHCAVLHTLMAMLSRFVTEQNHYVLIQSPISLPPFHEPEPDLAIVRGAPQDFLHVHPGASEVTLVVEVSLSSLRPDRTSKRLLYGSAGIREYWIVDVDGQTLEVYQSPSDEGYRSVQKLNTSDSATLSLNENKLRLPLSEFLIL